MELAQQPLHLMQTFTLEMLGALLTQIVTVENFVLNIHAIFHQGFAIVFKIAHNAVERLM